MAIDAALGLGRGGGARDIGVGDGECLGGALEGGGGGGAAGASAGGGGGGAIGVGAEDIGTGGGSVDAVVDKPDGFRDEGKGGGFLPTGGGGGFDAANELSLVDSLGVTLRRWLELPGGGRGGLPGMLGAAPGGGFGAEERGLETKWDGSPESDMYVESEFAPVSTPPLLFFNLGIPPANSPPSCGAPSIAAIVVPDPVSLLLLTRLPGTGGASPPGGPPIPGIKGAPPTGGPPPDDEPATDGADRSFVTAFLRAFPLWISCKRDWNLMVNLWSSQTNTICLLCWLPAVA